jgi:hypothetical protein
MGNQTEVQQCLVDEIHSVLEQIEAHGLDEIGLSHLDVDDLRSQLEPLIADPRQNHPQLKQVRNSLELLCEKLDDWQAFRENIESEIAEILADAALEPDEEEVAAQRDERPSGGRAAIGFRSPTCTTAGRSHENY